MVLNNLQKYYQGRMIFLLVKVSLIRGRSKFPWRSIIITVASCTDGKMISPAFVVLYSVVSIEPNALSVEHVSVTDCGEAQWLRDLAAHTGGCKGRSPHPCKELSVNSCTVTPTLELRQRHDGIWNFLLSHHGGGAGTQQNSNNQIVCFWFSGKSWLKETRHRAIEEGTAQYSHTHVNTHAHIYTHTQTACIHKHIYTQIRTAMKD